MKSEVEYISSVTNVLSKHKGEWIVVVGEDIVYIGQDPEVGYDKAQEKYPGSAPYIMQIPEGKAMLL